MQTDGNQLLEKSNLYNVEYDYINNLREKISELVIATNDTALLDLILKLLLVEST